MTGDFRIVSLAGQDRQRFQSGVEALDRYLREQAGQDARRRVGNCFVVVDSTDTIAGYYTFAATSVPLGELPSDTARKLPPYPNVPAGLVGRLAVDEQFQRRGLGAAMIADAVSKAKHAAPAIFALVVDAKDENAAGFYRRHTFRPLVGRPLRLFLPIATAEEGIARGTMGKRP